MSLDTANKLVESENAARAVRITPRDTRVLRCALRSAIKSCNRQAWISMSMVVLSILTCITVLLVGDKVDYLLMSAEQKHALARADLAKAKIMEKFASYDDKVVGDMDVVYDKIRSSLGLNLVSPDPSMNKGSAPETKPSTADKEKPVPSVDTDTPPPEASYVDPSTVSLPVEKYEEMKAQTKLLQEERTKLKNERDNLEKLTDPILKDQNNFYREKIANSQKELENFEQKIKLSDQQREALWKSREEQSQKIGTLNEKLSGASTMSEFRSIFSTAFIRGGALFLLVWLVKIFVRKYQHAINGKEFYSSALNALRIKGVNNFAEFEAVSKGLRLGNFELRDADIELLGEKLGAQVGGLLKPFVK